ncbi:hypothetical protein T459_08292 [Capsicum annuum]|uniref:Uncharacterized protein n=1 Tax=Capsicum annuum TaxID=4072 RepID=A0A2G2ZW58_CAPAN|nr:hypothetical protein T459_08292 [Capsicum annuum]
MVAVGLRCSRLHHLKTRQICSKTVNVGLSCARLRYLKTRSILLEDGERRLKFILMRARSGRAVYTGALRSVHAVYTRALRSVHTVYTRALRSVHAVYTRALRSVHTVYTRALRSILTCSLGSCVEESFLPSRIVLLQELGIDGAKPQSICIDKLVSTI